MMKLFLRRVRRAAFPPGSKAVATVGRVEPAAPLT
jgi:hypothetical protein